ncbi:conserved protein of unknown function [Candidatus Filomicrobium marinum]|uniref:Uncharacterized protein n=1 Tax=Candidatus Filomicrobium marinum TaxID=1608628 RepID=A0A0D6JDI9_9HYPH|nr:conserved protein of unknown function [Candidatus Filomicrobium marinum]CPR17678.1 conserved protein of unknown function [Candidatus Filomicrobium marinum]
MRRYDARAGLCAEVLLPDCARFALESDVTLEGGVLLNIQQDYERPSRGKVMVPLARLERARPCGQQILSLSRLPIPPQRHTG